MEVSVNLNSKGSYETESDAERTIDGRRISCALPDRRTSCGLPDRRISGALPDDIATLLGTDMMTIAPKQPSCGLQPNVFKVTLAAICGMRGVQKQAKDAGLSLPGYGRRSVQIAPTDLRRRSARAICTDLRMHGVVREVRTQHALASSTLDLREKVGWLIELDFSIVPTETHHPPGTLGPARLNARSCD